MKTPSPLRGNRLFFRLFWAFMATLLVSVITLSILVVAMVRGERTAALENEVRVQARDVAKLMQQYDIPTIWGRNTSLANTLTWKIEEIRQNYGANVWLVTASRLVWVLGDTSYDRAQLNDPLVVEQINQVLSGAEIRVQALIPELGADIVTVGVPWMDESGNVDGAVLLHISTLSLSADYTDMLKYAAIAAAVSMALGAALSMIIARRQIEPLTQMRAAVTDFAAGKLDRRVNFVGDKELTELGDAFNAMAGDLENLENSRRSFVANVSHELRSPLTCIQGYIEGMLDGTIPEEEREKYLGVVRAETQRLSKLVGALLDLSRIESGNLPMHPASVDICELLRLELIKFEGKIDEKRLDVAVELPEEPVYALCDADGIRQVVTNLLDNAVKYANDGGQLGLRAAREGTLARVTVTNTGEPIPQSDLPHIFDRFYKVDKAHTAGKGTGLGLSIVQKILEQHGAKIRAASDETQTAFTFTLPLTGKPGEIQI